jgi:hypothetical protein
VTVAELIERLKELPGELTAQGIDYEYGPYEITAADVEDYAGARTVVLR